MRSSLSVHVVSELIKSISFTTIILSTSILDEIEKRSKLLNSLIRLKYVLTESNTVITAVVDAIITKTQMLNILNETEFECIFQLAIESDDWTYIASSSLSDIEFKHHSKEQYEMFVVRKEELKNQQSTFKLFLDLCEYDTRDLYVKHFTKSDLWLYRERCDDIIVFLNEEKINSVSMKNVISSHSKVCVVLTAEQDRFETALLIKSAVFLKSTSNVRAKLIEELWTIIQEVNRQQLAHSRIFKTHILFTTLEKLMLRANKETVQRRLTIDSYVLELNSLYVDAEIIHNIVCFVIIDSNDLRKFVLKLFQMTTSFATLKSENDLFARDMNSLQMIQTKRYLNVELQKTNINVNIASSTIYICFTAFRLIIAIKELSSESRHITTANEKTREKHMKNTLQEYLFEIKLYNRSFLAKENYFCIIVLTDFIDSLNCYLLDILNRSFLISKIYCLNRFSDFLQK